MVARAGVGVSNSVQGHKSFNKAFSNKIMKLHDLQWQLKTKFSGLFTTYKILIKKQVYLKIMQNLRYKQVS
jgi:hypothetical protein